MLDFNSLIPPPREDKWPGSGSSGQMAATTSGTDDSEVFIFWASVYAEEKKTSLDEFTL